MSEERKTLIAVERAIGEYRRGRPVLLRAPDGSAAAALSAELAAPDWLDRLKTLGGEHTMLALTQSRALALKVRPTGHDVVLLPLTSWLNAATISGLADATTDLSQPLRGPFDRELRPPSAQERAAVNLAKAARLLPAAVVAPVAEPDAVAAGDDLLSLATPAIEDYENNTALQLRRVAAAPVPLAEAENSRIIAFRPRDGGIEHLAIVIGDPDRKTPVLTRLHSECFTGDLLGSLKCDCGEQLRGAIGVMREAGAGVLLYLAQEGRGIGLINKLRAYQLQAEGFDTVDANLRLGFDADERVFRPAAEMLRQLGIASVRLLTNNPDKVAGLEACGIAVAERVEHVFPSNAHNEFYLATKRSRSGHLF